MRKEIKESAEIVALINEKQLVKRCEAGSRDRGFSGCGKIKPLYDFPRAESEPIEPGADGIKRKAICRECRQAYNRLKQKERRAQSFTTDQALKKLSSYARNTLKTEAEKITRFRVEQRSPAKMYAFLELEAIKKDMKAELKGSH